MANGSGKSTAETRRLSTISFPYRKEKGEFPKREFDVEAVKNDLFLLFKTPIRSRVMRPTLGTNAYSLVFEGKGALLEARLQRSVRNTIFIHEPRVRVDDVIINDTLIDKSEVVDVLIVFTVQGIQDFIRLQFPKTGTAVAA